MRTCTRKPMRTDESMSRTCFSCLPMLTCAAQQTDHQPPSGPVVHAAAGQSGCLHQKLPALLTNASHMHVLKLTSISWSSRLLSYHAGGRGDTCAASLAAVLVQMHSLSCLARTLTTMPQISSPSVNCSPMHASSCGNGDQKTLQHVTCCARLPTDARTLVTRLDANKGLIGRKEETTQALTRWK